MSDFSGGFALGFWSAIVLIGMPVAWSIWEARHAGVQHDEGPD